MSVLVTANESIFVMAGYSSSVTPVPKLNNVLLPAGGQVEDTFCYLIINVKPEPKLIKDLLPVSIVFYEPGREIIEQHRCVALLCCWIVG
jgi:hypothetical protein